MNVDVGIRLQAYLDGELTGREAQQVAALIESDAGARALFGELQQTRTWLKSNEPELSLPESREFFWSKVEREIEPLEKTPASGGPSWLFFLRRHVAAVGGLTVAAALVIFAAVQMNVVPTGGLLEEIDNPLDEVGTFSFRSESQKMTLVWISNPFADAEESSDVTPMPMPIHLPEDIQ